MHTAQCTPPNAHRPMHTAQCTPIGLAECVPEFLGVKLFDGGAGAFVNVVGLAASKTAFSINTEQQLRHVGARMIALEDVEPFEARTKKWQIDEELALAAASVKREGDVVLATIDIYIRG